MNYVTNNMLSIHQDVHLLCIAIVISGDEGVCHSYVGCIHMSCSPAFYFQLPNAAEWDFCIHTWTKSTLSLHWCRILNVNGIECKYIIAWRGCRSSECIISHKIIYVIHLFRYTHVHAILMLSNRVHFPLKILLHCLLKLLLLHSCFY